MPDEVKKKEKIRLGSGKLYAIEFTKAIEDIIAEIEKMCVPENLLGYISGGATLEYKPTFQTVKDDLGYVEKTILTDEEGTLKSGIMTFNADRLKMLCATGRVTDSADGKKRILKIGGVGNADGKKYLICFHHTDKVDGDFWIVIVGQNQSGFSLAFAKDKETVIDAEFKALVQDDEGTIITLIEEKTDAAVTASEVSQQSETASTTAKSTAAKANS